VASLRLVLQLALVGFFLRQVFALSSPWLTALVVAAMLGAAAFEVGSRQRAGWPVSGTTASAAAASRSPPSASRCSPWPAACARSPGTMRATPSRWSASFSARR
jgi:putative ABC transport system permease protein